MKGIIKILSIFALVIIFGGAFNVAKADEVIWHNFDTGSHGGGPSQSYYFFTDTFFIPRNSPIANFSIEYQYANGVQPHSFDVKLYRGNSTMGTSTAVLVATTTLAGAIGCGSPSTCTLRSNDFPIGTSLIANTYYFMEIRYYAGASLNWTLGEPIDIYAPNGSASTLQFLYPSGSSTPLFSPFLLKTSNDLIDGGSYQVRLQYWVSSKATGNNLTIVYKKAVGGFGRDFMNNGVKIDRDDFGQDFASTTDLHATAQLYDYTDPDNLGYTLANGVMIASASSTWDLINIPDSGGNFITPRIVSTSTWAIATTTSPIGAIENPTLDLGVSDCSVYPWTDTYTGINIPFLSSEAADRAVCETKKLANDLIASTGKFGSGKIETAIGLTKKIFPINIIAALNEDIQAAQATSTDVKLVLNETNKPNVWGGRSYTILSSSTASWAEEQFDYKSLFDKIIYLVLGLAMLEVAFSVIKRSHRAASGS